MFYLLTICCTFTGISTKFYEPSHGFQPNSPISTLLNKRFKTVLWPKVGARVARGTLRWRQNGRDSVSNHQPHDCLPSRLFRHRSKKTSKLRVTGLCAGNSPGTGEFPAQMASYAENVSIWWRHHDMLIDMIFFFFICGTVVSCYV